MILYLLPLLASTQEVRNVKFEQAGKKIIIYYDLDGRKDYNVKVFCSTNNGKSWGSPLKEVSGDVGGFQRSGKNRMIIWDVLNEKEELSGDISFKVEAKPSVKTYTSVFLPVFIPGARVKHYPRGEGMGIFKSVVFWGLMGSSLGCKLASNNHYDNYHKATTQDNMDKYYTKANNLYGYFQLTLYTGIAVWGYDMLYYLFRGFKPKNSSFAVNYDQQSGATNLTFVYKF